MLHRATVPEQRPAQGIHERLRAALHQSRMAERVPCRHDVDHDDAGESSEPHDEPERAVCEADVAEHDQPHLADRAVCDHHREVHDEEREVRAEAEEVDAARGLATPKEPDVPGNPCRDRG